MSSTRSSILYEIKLWLHQICATIMCFYFPDTNYQSLFNEHPSLYGNEDVTGAVHTSFKVSLKISVAVYKLSLQIYLTYNSVTVGWILMKLDRYIWIQWIVQNVNAKGISSDVRSFIFDRGTKVHFCAGDCAKNDRTAKIMAIMQPWSVW